MARIRTIKPEFWSHPIMTKADDSARLAAIGLLNFADDEGYFIATPGMIRSQLWPLDEDSSKARRVLAQLAELGWIELREHPEYGAIGLVVGFTKHQKIDRPSPSRIKSYFDSTNIRRNIDECSLLDQGIKGSRDQGGDQGAIVTPSNFDAEMESIMQADRILNAKIRNEPPVYSFQDWRLEHPLIVVGRTGEDGALDDWRRLWSVYGRECLDVMYQCITKNLAPGKKIWFSMAAEWLAKNTKEEK